MDWYKFFQIAIPSISAGGTAVLGCYLCYFKKKFATYGDIEGKLEKLPKLSEIEHAIASAKNSSEFEYHIRKEQLIHFETLIKKILSMDYFFINYCKNTCKNANRFALKCNKDPSYFTFDNYEKDTHKNDDFSERIDEIELKFKMHIEILDNEEFNHSFNNWLKQTDELHKEAIHFQGMMHDIMCINDYGKNPPPSKDAIEKVNELAHVFNKRCEKSKVFSEFRKTLFKECGNLSRTMGKKTSHNADYV